MGGRDWRVEAGKPVGGAGWVSHRQERKVASAREGRKKWAYSKIYFGDGASRWHSRLSV